MGLLIACAGAMILTEGVYARCPALAPSLAWLGGPRVTVSVGNG
jgi:hypothetical protein